MTIENDRVDGSGEVEAADGGPAMTEGAPMPEETLTGLPVSNEDIDRAERFLAASDIDAVLPMLQEMAQAVDAYAQSRCQATDRVQWFSFSDSFERLAYRRVERDPRNLVQMPVALDRLYADLGYACIRLEAWEPARDALMQAVRWNPMNCNYRLDLAEVFRALGNEHEWAALSASVLERASDARSLARAYANLGQHFAGADNPLAASGCLRLARGLVADDPRVTRLAERLDKEHPELASESDGAAVIELANQGIETNANAEIAICLLMCASDAAAAGNRDQAARYTVRARDLIGQEACAALIQLIHESDAELAEERAAGDSAAEADVSVADSAAPASTEEA